MQARQIFRTNCSQSDPAFDDNAEHYLCAIGEGQTAICLDEIRRETEKDVTLSAVIKALESGDWPQHLIRYQAFVKELGVTSGIVVRDERIVLPSNLRAKALDIAHRGHPGVVAMRRNLREKVWWPGMDGDVLGKNTGVCVLHSCQSAGTTGTDTAKRNAGKTLARDSD